MFPLLEVGDRYANVRVEIYKWENTASSVVSRW